MELHRFFRYAIEKMCKEKKSLNHFYANTFYLQSYIKARDQKQALEMALMKEKEIAL